MKCKECSGKISDCDTEGMWIEECRNCHGRGYICTDITDNLDDRALLADAKVGDIVRLKSGDIGEVFLIDTAESQPDPRRYKVHHPSGGFTRHDIYGKVRVGDDDDYDIVSTEHLAPEGSAEWAWQMLKLGKKVTNKQVFHTGGCIIGTDTDKKQFCLNYKRDGWQIYTEPEQEPEPDKTHPAINGYNRYDYIPVDGIKMPKPQPQYNVGDWVEVFWVGRTYHGCLSDVRPGTCEIRTLDLDYPEYTHLSFNKNAIVRKLDPSEVIVNIGCLSGTVELMKCECCKHIFILRFKSGKFLEIPFEELDTPTAELVRELIKAQEEI